jgi:hypothetical protein
LIQQRSVEETIHLPRHNESKREAERMSRPYFLPHTTYSDFRGELLSINFEEAPFPPNRVYFISSLNTSGVPRVSHAHKKLSQIVFALSSVWEVELYFGTKKSTFEIQPMGSPLFIPERYWRNAVCKNENGLLGVIASQTYDEADYIRNYEDYLDWINSGAD